MPEEQPAQIPKPTNWPKIILTTLALLTLLTGATYTGYWYGTQQTRELNQAPQSTTVPVSNLIMDTAGWGVYKNQSYGYSVNYPPDWTVRVPEDIDFDPFIYFDSPRSDNQQGLSNTVAIRVYPKASNISLEDWVDKTISEQPKADTPVVKTPTQIGSFVAWRIEGLPTGPGGSLGYFVELGENALFVSGGPYFESEDDKLGDQSQELRRVLHTMVSTLTKY